jgi:hypothetical protein
MQPKDYNHTLEVQLLKKDIVRILQLVAPIPGLSSWHIGDLYLRRLFASYTLLGTDSGKITREQFDQLDFLFSGGKTLKAKVTYTVYVNLTLSRVLY